MKILKPKKEKNNRLPIFLYLFLLLIVLIWVWIIGIFIEDFKTFGGFGGLFWAGVLSIGLTAFIYFAIIRPILKKTGSISTKNTSKNKVSKGLSFNINGVTQIENPFAGVFIAGGAGSGKSKSLIEPIIKDSGEKEFTGIVYDFKFPELAQYVSRAYENRKVKPYYFNFTDLSRSNKVNPIAPEQMPTETYAREYAFTILANLNKSMISKPDFWSDNSTAYLSAIFWYLRTKHPQYCSLPHAISMVMFPNFKAVLMELTTVPKCADMIAPLLTAYEQGADNQLAGVLSSLQISLGKINIDEIYYLMKDNEVDLALNNPEKPSILVVGNNPTLSDTYAPILSLIMSAVSKQLNQQDKEKSIFLVDEFPTMYIPNIEQLPATARSNKVATILACQDIAQLQDKYGKEKSETILSNLGNQFFGRTPNPATSERISRIFGKEDKLTSSTQYKKILGVGHWAQGKTESLKETNLVQSQDVSKLPTGHFYTILSEGKEKHGLSEIPMNSKFVKRPIEQIREVTPEMLSEAYNQVKNDVTETILKTAIEVLKTQKIKSSKKEN